MSFDKIRRKFAMYDSVDGRVASLGNENSNVVDLIERYEEYAEGRQSDDRSINSKEPGEYLEDAVYSVGDVQEFIDSLKKETNMHPEGEYVRALIQKLSEKEDKIELDIGDKRLGRICEWFSGKHLVIKVDLSEGDALVLGEVLHDAKVDVYDTSSTDGKPIKRSRIRQIFERKKSKVVVEGREAEVNIYGRGINVSSWALNSKVKYNGNNVMSSRKIKKIKKGAIGAGITSAIVGAFSGLIAYGSWAKQQAFTGELTSVCHQGFEIGDHVRVTKEGKDNGSECRIYKESDRQRYWLKGCTKSDHKILVGCWDLEHNIDYHLDDTVEVTEGPHTGKVCKVIGKHRDGCYGLFCPEYDCYNSKFLRPTPETKKKHEKAR